MASGRLDHHPACTCSDRIYGARGLGLKTLPEWRIKACWEMDAVTSPACACAGAAAAPVPGCSVADETELAAIADETESADEALSATVDGGGTDVIDIDTGGDFDDDDLGTLDEQ